MNPDGLRLTAQEQRVRHLLDEGRSVADIASELDMSLAAAENCAARVRNLLRSAAANQPQLTKREAQVHALAGEGCLGP